MSLQPNDVYPEITLPASKSIHNRVLILNSIYQLNLNILNPSDSEDTRLMETLLKSHSPDLYCENAGTVMRFLTAYSAILRKNTILSGSPRMLRRPIGALVDTLINLGAEISYLGEPGYPPVKILNVIKKGGKVSIRGDVSSQYVSALAMIGPKLKGGLQIEIEGNISSKPYIDMTLDLMRFLGFETELINNSIHAREGTGIRRLIEIEPDWSAVAFWFQLIAFSKRGKVLLNGLKCVSIQGDSILREWSAKLGIKLTEVDKGVVLEKSTEGVAEHTEWDFLYYPDLAPAVIVLLSAFRKKARFRGLEALTIKESDRIFAIQSELRKCGVIFEPMKEEWVLDASGFNLKSGTVFEHYSDHRIAMALAALSILKPVRMRNPEVVKKSYPGFWKDMEKFKASEN